MKEVTVQQLRDFFESKSDFQLIDVREDFEHEISNLGGELIPLGEIENSVKKINRAKWVILYCRSGARSGRAVQWLEENYGFNNLYNLKGGILAWADQIDNSLPVNLAV